jgi:hypothetical protein
MVGVSQGQRPLPLEFPSQKRVLTLAPRLERKTLLARSAEGFPDLES